jgi:hypothetical protein
MTREARAFPRSGSVLLAGVLLAAMLGIGSTTAAAGSRDRESWLFVVGAATATSSGSTLVLHDVDPRVAAFTERPARSTARFGLDELVEAWSELGLDDVPPNAAISWFEQDEEHTIVVELADPRRDGDSVTFETTVIEDPPRALRSRTAERRPSLPAEMSDVVLLIDRVRSIPINSQMTD